MSMISRRTFITIAGMGALSAVLAGCTSVNEQGASSASSSANSTSSAQDNDAQTSSTNNQQNKATSIVVYFSRADENYDVGYVNKGNTQIVAEQIAQDINADTFHIQTVEQYPQGYDDTCNQAQEEKNDQARPQLQDIKDISDYDTIYLGYPIWWGDMPMAVYTYLESQNWQGKTIAPFCTSGGSGISGTIPSLRQECAGANVLQGLSIDGTTAQNDPAQVESQVSEWLSQIGQ